MMSNLVPDNNARNLLNQCHMLNKCHVVMMKKCVVNGVALINVCGK